MAEEHIVQQLQITDFTEETREGNGVFDSFMRATKSHIAEEYNQGRIKGPEYATVYLSALNATADRALEFLMRKDEQWLKNRALEVQLEIAQLEKEKVAAEILLINAQTSKMEAEERQVEAEIKLLDKRLLMLEDEQKKLQAEVKLVDAQVVKTNADVDLIRAQIDKLLEENKLLEAQAAKIYKEIDLITRQMEQITADIALTNEQADLTDQQRLNAIIEGTVLKAQECKLRAEYDMIIKQIEKIASEIGLLNQRTQTEEAQTNGAVIGDYSILDTQRILYARQGEGYLRDAEQKAAKMMIDTWNVRRTTDEGESAPDSLSSREIDQVVAKLVSGLDQR